MNPGVRIVDRKSGLTEPETLRLLTNKEGTGTAMEIQKKEQVFQASRHPRKKMKKPRKITSVERNFQYR
jgi:hypothetical protein